MFRIDASDVIVKLGFMERQILSAIPLAHQAIAEDLIAEIRRVSRQDRDFPKEASGRFLGGLNSVSKITRSGITTRVESSDRDSKYIDRTSGEEYVVAPGEFTTDELLNPITKWAKDKGIELYSQDKSVGAPSVSRYSALDSDQKFPIFAIARKVARDGIKNTKIFLEALENQRIGFGTILESEINKSLL